VAFSWRLVEPMTLSWVDGAARTQSARALRTRTTLTLWESCQIRGPRRSRRRASGRRTAQFQGGWKTDCANAPPLRPQDANACRYGSGTNVNLYFVSWNLDCVCKNAGDDPGANLCPSVYLVRQESRSRCNNA